MEESCAQPLLRCGSFFGTKESLEDVDDNGSVGVVLEENREGREGGRPSSCCGLESRDDGSGATKRLVPACKSIDVVNHLCEEGISVERGEAYRGHEGSAEVGEGDEVDEYVEDGRQEKRHAMEETFD